jgi:N-acetylmuramoyl-L-alanine amidase
MNHRIFYIIIMQCLTILANTFCSDKPAIIALRQSPGHYSKRNAENDTSIIDTLVMHYTEETLEKTLKIFLSKTTTVSSHYIIGEEGIIFRNTKPMFAAHHAGDSYWNGASKINPNSLGIEHVNLGFKHNDNQPAGVYLFDREWYAFTQKQIDASIALSKHLVTKYAIKPENVVGHSDIAPKRKIDPGPLFPWQLYAQHGVGAWPNFHTSWDLPCFIKAEESQTRELWLIEHLHIWGYKLPDEQACGEDIIRAFQMHFRQSDISGIADLETATILNALICNYKTIDRVCPCTLTE